MSKKEEFIRGLNEDPAADEVGHARELSRLLKGI